MTESKQVKKRERASQMSWESPASRETRPDYGPLDVQFGCPFDCMCYMATVDGLAGKKPEKYNRLMEYLATETGCTEREVIAHGQKVRALLWFAVDRFRREGQAVARKLKYPLPAVRPAF